MKRVEIKQVATEREARAEGGRALWARRIAAFDAGGASCKLEADRERLLGTIEAGFGGYEAFNRAIRATLLEAAGVQHLATGGDERASEGAVQEDDDTLMGTRPRRASLCLPLCCSTDHGPGDGRRGRRRRAEDDSMMLV